jgi:hypothetical protein
MPRPIVGFVCHNFEGKRNDPRRNAVTDAICFLSQGSVMSNAMYIPVRRWPTFAKREAYAS